MANEPTLRKTDIEDLEDRVTILEGGTPEPHSNTMTKPELEDLEDRITVLEGGTPGTHSNPMRFEFFTSVEDRVEELEEEDPTKAILVVDMNGGQYRTPGTLEPHERYEETYDKGTSITLLDLFDCTFIPPSGYGDLLGFTTTKDDETTMVGNTIVLDKNTTLYALWEQPRTYTLTYNFNGGVDYEGNTKKSIQYAENTVVDLLGACTLNIIEPEGKIFGGWADETDPCTFNPLTVVTMNKDIEVFAYWEDSEPTLTNITPGETLNGIWVKPTVTVNTSDPIVSDIYDRLANDPSAAFYYSGSNTGSIVFDSGSSDAYELTAHISDSAHQLLIVYTRNPNEDSSVSGGRQDTYHISGAAYDAQGTLIDLSSITRPVYIPLLFETPQSIDDLDPSEDCADFACLFFFKEDQ